jgi:tetrahedral aminopeptidase
MEELRDLLGRLSNAFGPSGGEKAVRALIRAEIEAHVDAVETDPMGNLIATKRGSGEEPRLKVMFSAHMDEVSFMVTEVAKSGVINFTGRSVDKRLLLAKRVLIGADRVPGVIAAPVPHLQSGDAANRVVDIDNLHIDIGAADEKGANAKVKIGDYVTFATEFVSLSDDPAWPTARGKAFDDRAGCAALVTLLQKERFPVDVVGVFSVQEEVGLRGAGIAAYRVTPDAAFALEGTVCDDLPQQPDEDRSPITRLGAGPAVALVDAGMVVPPGIVALLRRCSEEENIPAQFVARGTGRTDASAIYHTQAGIPAGTISIPCRYIHSPASILNLNDLDNTVRLAAAALRRIDRADLQRLS